MRASPTEQHPPPPNRPLPLEPELEPTTFHRSAMSIASYYTASEETSIAAATEGGSHLVPVHRFTLIKPGTSTKRITSPGTHGHTGTAALGGSAAHGGWSALDFFFASGLLPGGGAKCDICAKRLGRKAVLECDDCGLRAHIKCGEMAPRDCAIRSSSLARVGLAPQAPLVGKAKSKSPSPFSHR